MVFHLALNIKPQEPLVIWTFSSLLCTKNWRRSVELARESALRQALSAPEISKSFAHMEDAELASKVSELASLVVTSIDSLTKARSLFKSISIFKEKPSNVLVRWLESVIPDHCVFIFLCRLHVNWEWESQYNVSTASETLSILFVFLCKSHPRYLIPFNLYADFCLRKVRKRNC